MYVKTKTRNQCAGQFVFYMEKSEIGTLHHTTCRNQFQVIKCVNMNSKTMKLWEEHIGEHLCILGIGKDFLIKTQITKHKGKDWHFDYIKIKNFGLSKDTIKSETPGHKLGKFILNKHDQQSQYPCPKKESVRKKQMI